MQYDPETFTTWCKILHRVPQSVLWLLRFPPYGEPRIRAEAAARGIDPARIIFTDVAAKPVHIRRSGIADVFLDTQLCNAHTTGALPATPGHNPLLEASVNHHLHMQSPYHAFRVLLRCIDPVRSAESSL